MHLFFPNSLLSFRRFLAIITCNSFPLLAILRLPFPEIISISVSVYGYSPLVLWRRNHALATPYEASVGGILLSPRRIQGPSRRATRYYGGFPEASLLVLGQSPHGGIWSGGLREIQNQYLRPVKICLQLGSRFVATATTSYESLLTG